MSLKKTKYAEYIRDFTAIGNPFLLLLVTLATLAPLPHFGANFLAMLFGFLLNEIFCSGIKFFWHKPRPNGQKFKNGFEKIDAGSFPSIHASRISFIYLSLSYLHYLAQNLLLIPVFIMVILVVGYSRTFLKKHFWFDVLAGYLFGIIQFVIISYFLLK